jgi:hypothetical protein
MIVRENGKLYEIDDAKGIVTMAKLDEEFRIGERVEVDGQAGNILTITSSMYGPAFGVRFDDGEFEEYSESQLSHTNVDKPDYETPVKEVFARFAAYEKLPAYTDDELGVKTTEARFLNRRAKSLVTDSKLSLSDQSQLDHIVLVTGTDLLDIQELQVQTAESAKRLEQLRATSYEVQISDDFGATLGESDDASWLGSGVEGMEVVETTDADLAARATEVVSFFDKEQLEDEAFMAVAASYQKDYLMDGGGRAEKFASFLERARQARLKELEGQTVKEAKHDDLEDIDPAALYM